MKITMDYENLRANSPNAAVVMETIKRLASRADHYGWEAIRFDFRSSHGSVRQVYAHRDEPDLPSRSILATIDGENIHIPNPIA